MNEAPLRKGAESRRDQILREAMECFAAGGFSGTTTRQLAARVGITEAALYRHFPSKEALYAAIIDRKMAAPGVTEQVAHAAAARDDAAVFGGLASAVLERGLGDPAFIRILFFSALEGHALSERFFAARVTQLREFLSGYIAARISEGAFLAHDPALAAHAFLGMVLDVLSVRIVFRQDDAYPQPLEQVVDTFTSIFLEGMRAR